MDKIRPIDSLVMLGELLSEFLRKPDEKLLQDAGEANSWFMRDYLLTALKGILILLSRENLTQWLDKYKLQGNRSKTIGIVMPGNIPLAGFHDLLCALISGNQVIIHPSHSDSVMINFIIEKLAVIDRDYQARIRLEDNLSSADGIIATGSDNTSRYFSYYFRNIPHIIRKNRTACCFLSGNETPSDLESLADDIFLYFGLGCRNVSKIFVPENYPVRNLKEYFAQYEWIIKHENYNHNYTYQRSLNQLTKNNFMDTGFFLFQRSKQLFSPIGVIYFDYYNNIEEITGLIENHQDKLQCMVSGKNIIDNSVYFGRAQFPMPWDYADQVDTLKFIEDL